MTITITSLKLRRLWHYFIMSYLALKIVLKIKSKKGFIKMKNTGFGYWHYTLTVWESERDMKNFAGSGEHAEAMKSSRKIATEVCSYTFEAEEIPDWREAKRLLFEKGKIRDFS